MNTIRKTVPLTGSSSPVKAELDAHSHFRLQYAQAFLQAAGSQLVRPSGVIRRALEVYLAHLATLEDPRDEFRRATSASRGSFMDAEAREEAAERFKAAHKAATEGTPPGNFSALLLGPHRLDVEAVTARAEELADAVSKEWRRPRKSTGRASS